MASTDRVAVVDYWLQKSREERQLCAARLHAIRSELERHLTVAGAYSAQRPELQKSITTINTAIGVLCRQEPAQ